MTDRPNPAYGQAADATARQRPKHVPSMEPVFWRARLAWSSDYYESKRFFGSLDGEQYAEVHRELRFEDAKELRQLIAGKLTVEPVPLQTLDAWASSGDGKQSIVVEPVLKPMHRASVGGHMGPDMIWHPAKAPDRTPIVDAQRST